MDRLVGDYVRRTGLPGAVVAVTRGDRIVRVAGYGHTADGTPMDAGTPVPVASLSKAMTAVAVLRLVDAGRIGLDRPVVEQLPGFTPTDPRWSAVSVRQLLNQTSGITDDTAPSLTDRPSDLAGAVAALRDTRLGDAPGAAYHYHNANYAIAARLVEVASGVPFPRYMADNVFAPLGMTGTRTVDATDAMPDRARGFVRAYGRTVAADEPRLFTQGAYGVVTTAGDLARWLEFQNRATGSSVLSGHDLDLQQTPPPGSGYAMGWWPGRAGPEHTGVLFTHNSFATLLPDTRTGIAVVTNTGTVSGDDAAVLGAGLVDLARGRAPVDAGSPFTLGADPVLAVLAVLAVGLAVLGACRAGRWARVTSGRPVRRVAGLVAVVLPAALLVLAGNPAVPLASGAVTVEQALLLWPALVVAWAAAVLGAAGVLVARALAVLRPRPVSGSTR